MKPRAASNRAGNRAAGKPAVGWRGHRAAGWSNPRPPSVPNTMDLRLDEYFAGAALVGVLSSQAEEPDQKWACLWAWKMGQHMAAEAKRRRKR